MPSSRGAALASGAADKGRVITLLFHADFAYIRGDLFNHSDQEDQAVSDTAFLIASAVVVALGVALRRLLPRDGSPAAPEAQVEQAAG